MSGCSCDTQGGVEVRISDELLWDGGRKARLRCRKCHGKAGFIPVDALTHFGIEPEEVKESSEPGPVQIHIDIGWGSMVEDYEQ